MNQEENISISQFECLFDNRFLKNPDILCKQGGQICKVCVNSQCQKYSLRCNEDDCTDCGQKVHEECATVSLNKITDTLNTQINFQKSTILKIIQIENQFIQKLRKTYESILKENTFGGLEDRYLKTIRKIYENDDPDSLRGSEANKLYQKIKIGNTSQKQFKKSLICYENKLEWIELNSNIMKKWVHYLKQPIDNDIFIESTILSCSPEKRNRQTNFLLKTLGHPYSCQRIFKASEHYFNPAAFHQFCDGIDNTLVLVRTFSGNVYGGFTKYPWRSAEYIEPFNDSGRNACTFSIDMGEKWVPQSDKKLISCSQYFGPYFGQDIVLNNGSEYIENFPNLYNRKGKNKLEKNEQTLLEFAGSDPRIAEYEVFHLYFHK